MFAWWRKILKIRIRESPSPNAAQPVSSSLCESRHSCSDIECHSRPMSHHGPPRGPARVTRPLGEVSEADANID